MVSWAPRLPPAVSGSGVRCGRVCWARVSPVPSPSWLGCRGVFFALPFFLFFFFFSGLCGPCPSIPFLSGWAGGSLFVFVFFPVSLFPVVRCYWLGVAGFGWVVPLCLCGGPVFGAFWGGAWPPVVVLAGGLAAVGCFRAFSPSPLLFLFFIFFWGGACLFLPLPSLGWRTLWPAFSVSFRAAVFSCVLWEPTNKGDFGNYGGTSQCTQDGLDLWQGIRILYSSRIQRSVVEAHAPFTIRFLHQQATRSVWTRGWSDLTRSIQLVQLSSKFI